MLFTPLKLLHPSCPIKNLLFFCPGNQTTRVLVIIPVRPSLCSSLPCTNMKIPSPPPRSPPNIYTIQLSLLHRYWSPVFTCRLWLWLMDRLQAGWISEATSRKKPSVSQLLTAEGRRDGWLYHSGFPALYENILYSAMIAEMLMVTAKTVSSGLVKYNK